MKWPPSESEWREILRDLPVGADVHAVRAMVERAIQEFFATAERDEAHRLLLRQIGKGGKTVETLRPLALQLSKFPLDRDTEALLQHIEALAQICAAAEIRAAIYLSRSREGRLFSSLSLAWTGPAKGDGIPISAQGPFVDFMEAIVGRILPPKSLDVKRFAKREKTRRKVLNIINERFAGQGGMSIDTYLIDASGQRKPG